MWPKRYARDFERAWARIRATRSEIVKTPWGDIEYGTEGTGRPVLMSHGIFGGHVEALGMTRTYYGEYAFAIAPSRFGYFGSDLPHDATPRAAGPMPTRGCWTTSASSVRSLSGSPLRDPRPSSSH